MRLGPSLLRTLLGLGLGLAFARAQDPGLKQTFLQAKTLWATQGDKEGATARFEQVLAVLEPRTRSLDAEWVRVLCETYNWLAVLDDRTPAKRGRAQQDLEALLNLDPDFDIDRSLTGARLQGIFDGLRSAKFGKVKVGLAPEGGLLTLDGKPATVGAGGVKYLTPGPHVFAYAKAGFRPVEQQLEVTPRESRSVDLVLVRVSSTVRFNTFPSGAEILLDGQSLGTSRGAAPSSAKPLADKVGLSLDQLSADFVLESLAPGKHVLEFRAPCFKPKRIALDEAFASPFADHILEPIRLDPSQGLLSVRATAPGGELFLSGKSLGPLPVENLPVCAGPYDLQVKFPAGGASHRIEIAEDKTVELVVRPKPRLAFLGLEGPDEFAGRDRILAMLRGLGSRLEEAAYLLPLPDESPQAAGQRFRAGREAELSLLARIVPGQSVHQIELVLTTQGGEEERYQVKPLEADPLGSLVSRLNARIPARVPWVGMSLLDLPGEAGPWVLHVDEEARKAGVKPFRAITAVNGKAVASVRAFRTFLEGFKGEKLTVAQGNTQATLPVVQQPVEIPTNASDLCYPFLLADLRLRLLGARGDEEGLLRLHQALALMHFRRYDKALEVLRDARMSTTQGVCQGTLDYYIGICLLRLGNAYRAEAVQALNRALACPQATLFGPDGPLVSPLAKQALEDLKP